MPTVWNGTSPRASYFPIGTCYVLCMHMLDWTCTLGRPDATPFKALENVSATQTKQPECSQALAPEMARLGYI